MPADEPLLRYWDTKPHVQAATGAEPGQDSDFNWAYELPRQVDWRELLIAEVDGRAIGFVQIIDAAREETHFWVISGLTYAPSISGSEKRLIWAKATGRR